MADEYLVEGRIRGAVKGRPGIHGLRVTVWAESDGVERLLGRALTRSDGRYRIELDDVLAEPRPRAVGVTIEDRFGNRVHRRYSGKRVRPGAALIIDVDVEESVLGAHLSEPTGFEPSTEPLVSAVSMIADVEMAVGRIVDPGDPRFGSARRAALCPDPPFELLDHLAAESFAVLAGDPLAGGRFRETLELLQNAPGGHTHDLEPAGRIESGGPARKHDATSATVPALPLERVVPIMAAAAYLEPVPGGLLGGVLGRVCEVETFGFLHRAAVAGLRSESGLRRFEGILKVRGFDECGPIDEPLPPVPRPAPRCDPTAAFYLECARAVAAAFRTPVPTYTVTSVQPARGCPGTTITIRGSGFGRATGTVVFNRRGGGSVDGRVTAWSDTSVSVVVPRGATCGLGLAVYERTDDVCGRYIDVYRRARFLADFEGAAAEVQDVRVNGRTSGVCVPPGGSIRVTWETCAADTVAVGVRDGERSERGSSSARDGSLTLTAPTTGADQEWTVSVTANGTCLPTSSTEEVRFQISATADLAIRGVEVTQAIQHYRAAAHLTDPNDRGAANSLPLVVGKAAWARVYLRSGIAPSWNDNGSLTGVAGQLHLYRVVGGSQQFVRTLDPMNAPVTARADYPTYRAERGDPTTTLNFRIPAEEMTGRLRLVVSVSADTICHGRTSDSQTVEVDVARRNRLQLRGVPFNFTPSAGSGFTSANAPTLNQLRQDAALAYALWPVAAPRTQDISVTAAQTTTLPLNDPRVGAGGCSNNWGTLLTQLNQAATNDGPRANTVYYAYLPASIPVGVPGCGSGGRGGGRQLDPATMAHEIGHGLGRPHSPCNVPGDNNYPVYEPYDSVVAAISPTNPSLQLALTSIGEWGLDIRNGTVFDPQTTADLMSYCGPNNWISKYVHRIVYGAGILDPQAVPVGAASVIESQSGEKRAVERAPLIAIWGQWVADDRLEVNSVMRLETVAQDGSPTPLIAELLGDDGRVLAAANVVALPTEGCGCGDGSGQAAPELPVAVRADIPDVAMGAALQVRRGDDVLWRRERPDIPPVVEEVSARVQKDGTVRLRWKAAVAEGGKATAWVTCSTPDGKDHQGVATGVTADRVDVDLSGLPGGPAVFEVRVSDGFSSAAARSDVVECPRRPPSATIMHPAQGQVIPAEGGMVALEAFTADADDRPLPDCVWELDGKQVATDADAVIPTPRPGRHTLRLRAGDASDQVTFTVAPPVASPTAPSDG